MTITAQATEDFSEVTYLLFDKKVIDDFVEFSIVDKLSTYKFSSPTTSESVTFANSLRVKLLCFGTFTQFVMKPQMKLQHQALMSHHQ